MALVRRILLLLGALVTGALYVWVRAVDSVGGVKRRKRRRREERRPAMRARREGTRSAGLRQRK